MITNILQPYNPLKLDKLFFFIPFDGYIPEGSSEIRQALFLIPLYVQKMLVIIYMLDHKKRYYAVIPLTGYELT